MASKLTEKQKQLLDANISTRVGQKPYEDGLWGEQGNKDFVHLQLFDESNNLIEFKSVPSSEFVINTDNNNIEFYPGRHIRELGYQSGVFNIKYNFLRKLAGDEMPVLLHTIQKNDTKVGDVYTNMNAIYVTEDSLVYAATEEDYKNNPTTTEQLSIEDLTYQIDTISPSRTEVRLKSKKINGSYQDDFIDLQTAIILKEVQNKISFIGGTLYDSTQLILTLESSGFLFTKKMVGGTITIPNVFQVNQIDVPVKTNINIVQNPAGDLIETDNLGNTLNIATQNEWDESLHDNAIRATHWSDGFVNHTGTFAGTAHIGYHAYWVAEEGKGGGSCIKFTDQNELFIDLPEWPNEQRYRPLLITQEITNLLGQGVTHNDIANINFDIRSTVANKGVEISLRYADEVLVEEQPQNPPPGFFDPSNPQPTETQPTSPPAGYEPADSAAANAIEQQPPMSEFGIRELYGDSVPVPLDIAEGDDTTVWGGAGAWVVTIFQPERPSQKYTWGVNTDVVGNMMHGELSNEEEWVWNAYSEVWTVNPNLANSLIAPDGTSGKPNAVNYHPAQIQGQGRAYYERTTNRGQNLGWQTMTVIGDAKVLLFKDDLIWEQRHDRGDLDKFYFYEFDQYFPAVRNTVLNAGTDEEKTLYDDIFQNGFIQTVTRVSKGRNDGTHHNMFLIFYNNGDTNASGQMDESSNRFFYITTYAGTLDNSGTNQVHSYPNHEGVSTPLHFLKDFDGGVNQNVISNEGKMEWWFIEDNGYTRYYIATGTEYYATNEGDNAGNDGGLYDGGIDSYYPAPLEEGFGDTLANGVDCAVGPVGGFGRYRYIIGDRQYRAKSPAPGGTDRDKSLNDVFFRCGEVINQNGDSVTFGVRNPSATNYGVFGDFADSDELTEADVTPVYDNGLGEYDFPDNPLQIGVLSEGENWVWDGSQWNDNSLNPPRYNYKSPPSTKQILAPEIAGEWINVSAQIPIPSDWLLGQKWYLQIYGSGKSQSGAMEQGIVWVDNVYVDFTLREQSQTIPVYKSYSAQIQNVSSDGSIITVNKTIRDVAVEIGANDDDEDGNPDIYNQPEVGDFDDFRLSYTNLNPRDLRTYLKFENNLFLTTNFKSDRVSVTSFPYSIVYKLYEPLPDNYEKFDECIVVKEMADPLEEKIKIIDFVNAEEPKLVLKTPDLNNVESPVQRRQTKFQTESEILTSDAAVSTALRSEFLSQSLDSVNINTDYSRFENFVNFGSAEVRIRNFKRKLEDIEQYKINSASYAGVSGSSGDMSTYHYKIIDTENKFDRFENYMYFKSSSYVSSSIGIFHDNAWPKASGDGTLNSPYVLAHTTSSQADTWFVNAVNSASLYDDDNSSKLSTILPEHIKVDTKNDTYLKFVDMIGQHFDGIWEYINAVTDVSDRRESLDEGISKDLLYSVAKSLGWNLNDGKDLISLSKFALGKEVTGSSFSNYSTTSERDVSREIWSRIINNMPFFLKNKGTVRALKGLINVYGIPSTILRVKEYGGPDLSDDASPQFEITRKFTKALDFKGAQYVKVGWTDDLESQRKPDTVEFRFRAATGSNQILVEKQDINNQDWFIRLKDNGSSDNYGQVSFILSGSAVGQDIGQFKEITSTSLPIYDGDFYSVMVARTSGSSNTAVSQSYQLNVGKYDASRSKIHLYSTSTMDVTQAASSSFSNAWTGSGDIYIGGSGSIDDVGVQFSGSIMEYRHWTETLNTSSFKNHIANPKAYDGNTVSSSYSNLVLRYSFNDDKDLTSDVEGIRDVSSNQTQTVSGSHSGFTGNFFRSVVDEQKTHIPSIGALRRTTNKIRLEDNKIKQGFNLNSEHRATVSAYDTAPSDSNKVGIWFAPTDVINTDIINSVGNLNFDNYLGDPRDKQELSYRGLENIADNYWKKYNSPNNFWDYIRMIKYYDQSLYPQIRKLIPARSKPDIGLLIEPNIFERPKVIVGKEPTAEDRFFSSSINIPNEVIIVTGSYNAGFSISDYDSYTGRIDIFSYDSGSSVISSSGEYTTYTGSNSEIKDRNTELSIWQRLGEGNYKTASITQGDVKYNEVFQPIITGSRIYGVNQKLIPLYSSSLSASLQIAYSSSFYNVDTDNYNHLTQGLINSFYAGVKNTKKTTPDSQPPIEVIISAPTKLVTTKDGESTLKTGDGVISEFKEAVSKEEKENLKVEKQTGIKKKKRRGLRSLKVKPETDQMRKKMRKEEQFKKESDLGVMKESRAGKESDDKDSDDSKSKIDPDK